MPRRAGKQCNVLHCPNITHDTYCSVHAHIAEENRQARHNEYKRERQDKKEQRFYSSTAWNKLRDTKRSRDPLCEHCLMIGKAKPVEEIDHIVEIKDDWSLRLTYSNLQSLCGACHRKKTQAERRKRQQKHI